ncbi:MAG TPA: hypothetical protein VG269_01030 [Tepidisphaeraceae bacterium]|jgi:hypothetical protein|nr:hypothetical protein [Tepidisphaeraceae bacterium]
MPNNAHAPTAPAYPGQAARRGPRRSQRKCNPERPARNHAGGRR